MGLPQSSSTKLKANAIPFPAPPQLSSPSPQEVAIQLPPVELSNERAKDTAAVTTAAVRVPQPPTAQQKPQAANEAAPEQVQQLYATTSAPEQPPLPANALGISFPTNVGFAPAQSHATPAPHHSPLRFPASEHPLPPFKGRSMSLGNILAPLGPSPPLPPQFDLSAQAPLNGKRSVRRADELQRGYDILSPGLHPPGAPSPLHHPHLHPSPPALHHHHSFPNLPQHPFAFGFPPPPPSRVSPFSPALHSPFSPAFYPPPTPQLYATGAPSLRHHHSFSCTSSHSSLSTDAPYRLETSPITPLHHSLPASPPLLALSVLDQVERPSHSSTPTTCDVWDCFAPANCEISPCSCVLCHRHLRIVIHGARVVEAVTTGTRTGAGDFAAEGNMKKLFECVGCRTRSQAVDKGLTEKQEDHTAGLGEFELGSFGVRDLPASPTTASTSPPPSSPPPRPRKVTLPLTIVQPAFPLTQAVTSRSRSASSPAALNLSESGNSRSPIALVRERVHSAPFSLPGGLVLGQTPSPLKLVDSHMRAQSDESILSSNRSILRLDNIPFLVSVAEIADWLPEGCRPQSDGPAPSIYIILHRQTGRTQPSCFIDNLAPETISRIIDARKECTLRGRPLRLAEVPHHELLQALFHQKPKGVHPNQVARQESPPRLPPKEELAVLIEACQKAGAGRGTLSFHPERPFLNIVHLIEKFQWMESSYWSHDGLLSLLECAEEAARIALFSSKRDQTFSELAERLKTTIITGAVFSSDHKNRMRNLQPLLSLPLLPEPVRHRKSFPSHSNPPGAPNDYSNPPSPTSYRPRRASLLGPNGASRRPSLGRAPSGLPAFPPLPSRLEQRPTALPLSPPETPPTFANAHLVEVPHQPRKSKSVGLLNGKGGWSATGLQMDGMQ